jgi:hypothetical protein
VRTRAVVGVHASVFFSSFYELLCNFVVAFMSCVRAFMMFAMLSHMVTCTPAPEAMCECQKRCVNEQIGYICSQT